VYSKRAVNASALSHAGPRVKRGAVPLEELTAAAQPDELPPAASSGMTAGADITEADPTVMRTRSMRAKMAGGSDLAATASGHDQMGWRRAGCWRWRPDLPLTRLTSGLASEACERRGFTPWSERFAPRLSGFAAGPKPTVQATQGGEGTTRERVETPVSWHDQPLASGSQ
jgi:hypothetical protein